MSAAGWDRIRSAGRHELAALRQAGRDPRAAQRRLLAAILAANEAGGFGREHGFSGIAGVDAYRARVPVRDYAGFSPWIERIRRGDAHALTGQAPVAFEETGGSSGGRKLVPYTHAGLDAFRRAVLAWLADLLEADPGIAEGRAYFAVSPATRTARRTEGELPVGLPSDAAYFGEDLLEAVAAVTLGAAALSSISGFEEWRLRTLAWLAAADDLTLVSVWSPAFLTALIDALERDPDPVAQALREGQAGLPALPDRARVLEESLRSGVLNAARLWPKLRLVSAWADASSARFAATLRARLPHARFQPKGLLATEGVFTLPLTGADAPVPALNSTFLEFEGDDGRMRLVDELEEGADYRLVVSTPGGFYRYRIGDVVRCTGAYSGPDGMRVPMLSFRGRAANTLDMVGEKLEEGFVADCFARCIRGFAALVPDTAPLARYLLLLDAESGGETAASAVEAALRRNPLYADARRTGALAPLRPVALCEPVERYCGKRLAMGHRLGDIKVPVTMPSLEAASAFWPELAEMLRRDSVAAG